MCESKYGDKKARMNQKKKKQKKENQNVDHKAGVQTVKPWNAEPLCAG